ncbi:HlyD family type I secretion periplasmic adaptor subunit [Afifella sp. IM 167]|uniref:HlyD family type I secretion periplasmic adaptor subunit n=1 Tax=Afifella sp. IM 167 TaxID=2033586 RepID=UPI001CCA9F9C|nr:HlyD family type I secretion periplasmic adaptor subunit [Afifella sp. IM 167]MBZ8135424.1 hypothetical protein [Afifella sp. IM 167]
MSLVTIEPRRREPGRELAPQLQRAIAHPVFIEETAPQIFVRRACIMIAVGFFALLGWSAIARVPEVSRAVGTILPSGLERIVQHYEGGVVQDILVAPGDLVEEGTPLFVLDDAATSEDVQVAGGQRRNILTQIEGLMSLTEEREANFSAFGRDDAVSASMASYEAERRALQSQRQLLESQIQQARLLISTYDAQLAALADDRAFAEDNYARIETLANKGYSTRTQLAERRKDLQDVENRTRITLERKETAVEKLGEAEKSLASFLATTKSDIARRVQELRASLTTLDGDVSKRSRRQDRLTVTSPVRGIVKSLGVTTIGGVVASGEALATIVPVGETLYAETRVPVEQIGYVKPDLPVRVKVSAFDFTRFGWLDGEVASISPSSFSGDGTSPYYKVKVSLQSHTLPFAPSAELAPGMEVTADIITGDKSILTYFLSPIRKALDTSFGER